MRPEVLYISRDDVQYSTPGTTKGYYVKKRFRKNSWRTEQAQQDARACLQSPCILMHHGPEAGEGEGLSLLWLLRSEGTLQVQAC